MERSIARETSFYTRPTRHVGTELPTCREREPLEYSIFAVGGQEASSTDARTSLHDYCT